MRNIIVSGNNIGICEGRESDVFDAQFDAVIIGYNAGLKSNLDDDKSVRDGGVAEVVARSSVFMRPMFGGLETSYKGFKSISVAVANNTKLIDVVDRTINIRGDEYMNSDKIKIFKTQKSCIALLIDTDILMANNWRRVAESSDIILGIALEISDEEASLVGMLSELYDKGYLLLATNRLEWRDIKRK